MVSPSGLPLVAAVIVNWNGGDLVRECVRSLVASTYPALQLIVVDNGSTDGSPQQIERAFPFVKLVLNGENLGYAEGANRGIHHALRGGASAVLIMNNDLTVDRRAVAELVSILRTQPDVGIVGAKIYRADDPSRLYCVWEELRYNHVLTRARGEYELDRGQYDGIQDVDCVCGAAMMVRREVFQDIGLFDPTYFAYQEQVDFCQRARQRGIRIVFVPRAKVWHHGEFSLRSREALHIKTYLLRRNSVLFMRRHGTWRTWPKFLLWVLASVVVALFTELGRGRPRFFVARIRGFLHGFMNKPVDGKLLFGK
ncbi:MAG: glycosyltransferase family 2 protein [Acidobacteria bacterium]|nr:MAG: glycosyltransferase family 2 protein [Acidobacteriota bacterium]